MRFFPAFFCALFLYTVLTGISMSILADCIPLNAAIFISAFNFVIGFFIYKMLRKW